MVESVAAWKKIRSLRFQEHTDPETLNPDGVFVKVVLDQDDQLYAEKER